MPSLGARWQAERKSSLFEAQDPSGTCVRYRNFEKSFKTDHCIKRNQVGGVHAWLSVLVKVISRLLVLLLVQDETNSSNDHQYDGHDDHNT